MDFEEFSKPTLIEPGTKYFLNQNLKQTHIYKIKFYNKMFNIGLFILFILILGAILLYKYKGRLTPMEKENKLREKQQYILTRIKKFQDAKRVAHQELITGLPEWENEYETIHKKNMY
jgi:Na+-transporting NADH:ubiquinone oxidoreductase subunit NqrC